MLIGVITLVATAILTALIAALIMNPRFRRDMLRGEGEAKVGNLVSARGVTIVLLAVVLAGVILMGLSRIEKAEVRGSASAYLQALSEAESGQMQSLEEKRTRMRTTVDRFMLETWYPTFLRNYADLSGIVRDVKGGTDATRADLLSVYALNAIREATMQRDRLLEAFDREFASQTEALRQDYRRRREAAVAGTPLADTTAALSSVRMFTTTVERAVSLLDERRVQPDSIGALIKSLR